jgi:hypothetical protein
MAGIEPGIQLGKSIQAYVGVPGAFVRLQAVAELGLGARHRPTNHTVSHRLETARCGVARVPHRLCYQLTRSSRDGFCTDMWFDCTR